MKKPNLFFSLIPVIFLVSLLIINVVIFKDDASYGPNQVALLLGALITGFIGHFKYGIKFETVEKGINEATSNALSAMIILIVIGALIGTWILSGTVPALIYYGLKIITPSVFLPVSCIACSVVSLATGSSWSTTGTIGIALIGIGEALGFNTGLVAGAIISGAYFGDKMSPLSDTTNLAAAMAGTDLFTHIKHMLWTTVPAITIALILFAIIGFTHTPASINTEGIDAITSILDQKFNITFFSFIPAVVVLILIRKKIPALPAITIGIISAVIVACLFQQDLLLKMMNGKSSLKNLYEIVISVSYKGFSIDSGHKVIDKLLNRGGMEGMLSTVWLIFSAMVFGGTLEATGMLEVIANSILKVVTGTGSLIGATIGTCIFLNATASDQYLAIVVPGRMFKKAYQDYNLAPQNLSRALEDAGTVTSVLIPWNSGGAYNSGVLGVPTLSYAPYCFFNILSPLISVFYGAIKFSIIEKSPKIVGTK
ncbi:MAG: Na+/H+ antiporter NhaC [Bacteriovoracaceae bacterium]|nr:Na+/H+ antiporter NhaC [Bacteriovoracaceae bacterium]